MSDDKITSIVSMGFSHEEAVEALKATNNEVETAIAFLLGDHTSSESSTQVVPLAATPTAHSPPSLPQRTPYYGDTVVISNPEDIPHFESNTVSYQSVLDIREGYPKPEDRIEPTVMIPISGNMLDNYLSPFLTIMTQLDRFVAIIHQVGAAASSATYEPRWFTHTLELEAPESVKESASKSASADFVGSLQLITAMLAPQTKSKRAFLTSKPLQGAYPPDFRRDLALVDEADECMRKFILSIDNNITHLTGKPSDLSKLFLSTVDTDSDSNQLGWFPIDSDSRKGNLYDSMTKLFWGDDANIGQLQLRECAPVMAFQIYEADSISEPFAIDEFFYPEVYSRVCTEDIVRLHRDQQALKGERKTLAEKHMDVNVFEGKGIGPMLGQVTRYLETSGSAGAPDATAELSQLQHDVVAAKHEINARMSEVASKMYRSNIYHRDALLENLHHHDLRRYVLIGVIFSDTEYFYRGKQLSEQEDGWYHIHVSYSGDHRVYDYDSDCLDFNAVKTYVLERTRDPLVSMILYYAAQHTYDEKVTVAVPTPVSEFINRDNLEIEEIRESQSLSDDTTPEPSISDQSVSSPDQEL